MSCCSGNNCTCGGNYTYIRFASDANGSDISISQNTGGLKRCYRGIIVSNVALDTTSDEFVSYFAGKWENICDCGCSGGGNGCTRFPYHVPTSVAFLANTWTFSGTSQGTAFDSAVSNKITVANISDGGKALVYGFKDDGGNLFQDLTNYWVKFDYDFTPLNSGDTVEISLGGGNQASVLTFDETDAQGTYEGIMQTHKGDVLPSVLRMFVTTSGAASGTFIITNIRFGTESSRSSPISIFDSPVVQIVISLSFFTTTFYP